DTSVTDNSIAAASSELKAVTERLVSAAKPTPIKDRIIGGSGEVGKLPAENAGSAQRGRELFTERGCRGCHSHAGTTEPGAHAPDLSRSKDNISNRAWRVQWLPSPNVYHPRTRMPITHLTVEQANDVAAWLLSQDAPKWSVEDPAAPNREQLKSLAKVYLSRV